MESRGLLHPIVLTTTQFKYSLKALRARREMGLPTEFARIMIDAYDILRVEEVRSDDETDVCPVCRISYSLCEKPEGADEERTVQHVNVRHSLDEVQSMMEQAKEDNEKPDWMD